MGSIHIHIAFRSKALLGLVGLGLPGRKVDSYSKGETGTVGMSNSDPEDLRNLMSQGGWSDPKTILLHYRRDVRERHMREAEKAIGQVRDSDESDPGLHGYG